MTDKLRWNEANFLDSLSDAIVAKEYDQAAEYAAGAWRPGDVTYPVPPEISSRCLDAINADPEAYYERVRSYRYAAEMERIRIRHAVSEG